MLGEPGTSEGKWQPSGGLTQPAEDRGRAGVGTPSSVSSPGAERRCAVALSVLWRCELQAAPVDAGSPPEGRSSEQP